MSNKIAIVIPAYNESSAILSVIDDIKKTFNKREYDIVVVDDGSQDQTAEISIKAGAIVISHIINSGSGAATTTGLVYATQKQYYLAATIDADGQHTANNLLSTIGFLESNKLDLAIGSRLIDSRGMSPLKRIGNKGLSLITYLLFGINVTDSQSGLRVFSRKGLDKIKLKTTGYEFCSEMLWRAKQQKLKIGESPIEAIYTEYSKSKGQSNWNAFMIIKALLARRITELFYE